MTNDDLENSLRTSKTDPCTRCTVQIDIIEIRASFTPEFPSIFAKHGAYPVARRIFDSLYTDYIIVHFIAPDVSLI